MELTAKKYKVRAQLHSARHLSRHHKPISSLTFLYFFPPTLILQVRHKAPPPRLRREVLKQSLSQHLLRTHSTMSANGSLMPRSDSFSRTRGSSHIVCTMLLYLILWCLRSRQFFFLKDFKTATTGVAAKAMKNELSRLVNTVSEPAKKVYLFNSFEYRLLTMIGTLQPFDTEMQSFFYLFTRYLAERAKGQEMCVSSI